MFRLLTFFTTCLLAIHLVSSPVAQGETILREDFVESPPHIPVIQEDLVKGHFLTLKRWGEGEDQLKRSFHEKIENDPHYVWNGLCGAPGALTFDFAHPLDLSADESELSLRTKNAGRSVIQIVLKAGEGWICSDERIGETANWRESSHPLSAQTWKKWDPETLELGDAVGEVDLSVIKGVGFFFPETPHRSKDCIRLDWFAVRASSLVFE